MEFPTVYFNSIIKLSNHAIQNIQIDPADSNLHS